MKQRITIELENGLTLQLDSSKYQVIGDVASSELRIRYAGGRKANHETNRITEPLNR